MSLICQPTSEDIKLYIEGASDSDREGTETVRAVTDKDREVEGKGGNEMKREADRAETEGKEMNTRRGRGVGGRHTCRRETEAEEKRAVR